MNEPAMTDTQGIFLTGNSIGILVIHGFGGSPLSIKPWADYLHSQGFTVAAPRLPGHGTRWQDLNRTEYKDWYDEVEKNFLELKKKSSHIFVAGFSSGGALALRLAQIRGSELSGILLVNPVVHDRRWTMRLLPFLRFILPSIKGGPTDVAAPNPPHHSYRRIALHALHSARKLWRVVERDLYLIENPLMIGYSPMDHVVDPENSITVIDNVSSIDIREVIFEKSFHNVSLDFDSEKLNTESRIFIEEVLTGEISSSRESDVELVRAEFNDIVAHLQNDGSDYLDLLDKSEQVESSYERALYAQPRQLPAMRKLTRNAIIALLGGPVYIVAIFITGFDPLGLHGWPGLIAMISGALALFKGMNNSEPDGDGSEL